jgi:hypothetical protein
LFTHFVLFFIIVTPAFVVFVSFCYRVLYPVNGIQQSFEQKAAKKTKIVTFFRHHGVVGRWRGVGRGLGVTRGIAVGVGVGPDCAQYLPPSLK